MQAVVLVGGFGTRLRPLTLSVPKPLLPIVHVSILERLMNTLAAGGVTDAVLSLGFRPQPFLDAFPDNICGGVRLSYAVEDSPLDTAGAIGFAARHAEIDETFIVANGDVICDLDVASLVTFHRSHGAQGTLHLTPVEDASQYGVVETDAIGKVQRFVEKPKPGETTSRQISAGTYVLEPSTLKRMPGDAPLSIERVTFPEMAEAGELFAMSTTDYWIDAGRPDTYIRANLDWVSRGKAGGAKAVHPTAIVAPNARIVDSIVGAGVRVGPNALVKASVLLPGAIIGANTRIVDSAVMGEVKDHAKLHGCLIGSEGVVGFGEQLIDARVPSPDAST